MVDRTTDNVVPFARSAPDAHGQAAMLLVESLLHGLIARQVISVADAVEIVDIAQEVKAEIAFDLGDSPSTRDRSLAMLGAIRDSLGNDVAGYGMDGDGRDGDGRDGDGRDGDGRG